jgi:competence protein ComEC
MNSMTRFLAVLLLALSAWLQPFVSGAQQPSPQRAEEPKAQTVYVTRTGKRYQRDGCRYLASSKIPMSLKDAKAKGYTPCKVCRPPQ